MLKIKPYLSQKIWGGDNLSQIYSSDIKNIGEALIVSGLKDSSSIVVHENNEEINLRYFYLNNKIEFGVENKEFPILIKILDASSDLSIQVHPSDSLAKEMNPSYRGKQECWYILNTTSNEIIAGTNAKSKSEALKFIENNEWNKLAKIREISSGDFISVVPGVIHAIKGGTTLYELQQPSDTTFRVYDYDRLENGKKRELHIDESIKSLNIVSPEIKNFNKTSNLVKNDYFSLSLHTEKEFKIKKFNFFVITNIGSKEIFVNGKKLEIYETFIITKKDNFEAIIESNEKTLIASV